MRVLLTGARGMLGSSIADAWLHQRPLDELTAIHRADVDLRDRRATATMIGEVRPDAIIHAAATVGGIAAKIARPTDYLLDNLLLDTSVLSAAIDAAVPELLYISSAAIYPDNLRQPLVESDLLAAPLEPANEGYAIAKLAAAKLCEYASAQYGFRYRSAVPSNLYGPNDNFSSSHGHLIAAALGKIETAKENADPVVTIWGDGTARREFTYSVDLAQWLVGQVGQLDHWPAILNLGFGRDFSIAEFYDIAKSVIGYDGAFEYDLTKPTGTPQRLLDSSAARKLGWAPQTSIESGMAATYRAYLRSQKGHSTS